MMLDLLFILFSTFILVISFFVFAMIMKIISQSFLEKYYSVIDMKVKLIINEYAHQNLWLVDATKKILRNIQNDLFDLGADLSTPYNDKENVKSLRIVEKQVNKLETLIDKYNKNLTPLNSFILPGGSEISAWLHLARTITRRAERDISKLSEKERINKFSLIVVVLFLKINFH